MNNNIYNIFILKKTCIKNKLIKLNFSFKKLNFLIILRKFIFYYFLRSFSNLEFVDLTKNKYFW